MLFSYSANRSQMIESEMRYFSGGIKVCSALLLSIFRAFSTSALWLKYCNLRAPNFFCNSSMFTPLAVRSLVIMYSSYCSSSVSSSRVYISVEGQSAM